MGAHLSSAIVHTSKHLMSDCTDSHDGGRGDTIISHRDVVLCSVAFPSVYRAVCTYELEVRVAVMVLSHEH